MESIWKVVDDVEGRSVKEGMVHSSPAADDYPNREIGWNAERKVRLFEVHERECFVVGPEISSLAASAQILRSP